MKCPNCGIENPEGSTFCNACGSVIKIQVRPESISQNGGILESLMDDEPTMSKGILQITIGGIIAGLGAIFYYLSEEIYIVTEYVTFFGERIPVQVQEQTFAGLAIPGIIMIIAGSIGIIIGILTYAKSQN